jgi:hypothetical protein
LICLICCAGAISAQTADSAYLAPLVDDPAPSEIYELLLPFDVQAAYATRAWVRNELPEAGGALTDLQRTDMIWMRAFNQANGNIGDALFSALVATFEHRTVPLAIGINLPLTLESDESFAARVAKLPSRIFEDSSSGNDRDKLQHFFASAWLAWSIDSREIADVIGLGVEVGEDIFVRGGVNDRRDIRANRLGQRFADLLRDRPRMMPSYVIGAWNREFARRSTTR